MKVAIWDIESNGLLIHKREKDGTVTPPMDRVHCVAIIMLEMEASGKFEVTRKVSAADQRGYHKGSEDRGWERMSIVDSLEVLAEADIRVAHNGQDFDERAIRKIYPWWKPKEGSTVLDTLLLSRLIYPDIAKRGPNGHKLFSFEKKMHSLEAWGKRLGEHKGDYKGGWATWSESMQVYMEQDAEVLVVLFRWLWGQKPATTAVQLEHQFAAVIRRLESRGIAFDIDKAHDLLAELNIKEAYLETSLINAFGEWWEFGKKANAKADTLKEGAKWDDEDDEDEEDLEAQAERKKAWLSAAEYGEVIIPTVGRAVKMVGFPDITVPRFSDATGKELKPYVGPPKMTYTQGWPYTPIKRVQFNPSSRTHIWKRLMVMYGWEPIKFTPGGKKTPPAPKVDEDVLRGLPYPEADLLAEYFLVLKRIGQLATGQKGWLKVVRETEDAQGNKLYRIHGRINTCGAATGRCTHSDPNLAQVPKNSAAVRDYPDSPELHGNRFRDLFIPGPGYVMGGFDGAALELRMYGHYLTPFDGGEYSRIVSEGRTEDGTDPHSWMRTEIIGEDIIGAGDVGRDRSKTVVYADLFGAGDLKRGSIVIPKASDREKIEMGKLIKARIEERFRAKSLLQAAIEEAVKERHYLVGLDGRLLYVRKVHASLNTLLQSAGAIVMKKALVILDRDLQRVGMIPGQHYEFTLNVHDEAQAEVLPDFIDTYREHATQSLPKAGKALNVLCPLKADAKFGASWAHTH